METLSNQSPIMVPFTTSLTSTTNQTALHMLIELKKRLFCTIPALNQVNKLKFNEFIHSI